MEELRARCGPTRIYHPSLYAFLIIGHEHNYSLSFLAIILKLASFFFAFGRRTGAVVVVGLGGEGRRWLISTHPPFGWESTFARTSPSMCLCDMRGEDEIFDFSPDENTFGRLESPALSRPEDDPPHVRRIFNFDHFPAGGFLPGFKKDRLFQYFYVTYIEVRGGERGCTGRHEWNITQLTTLPHTVQKSFPPIDDGDGPHWKISLVTVSGCAVVGRGHALLAS